jgi:hypothetical protein
MERRALAVKQAVDIWSLGCVLSEVAVWLVHDKNRLETYRQQRQDETKQLYDFRDGGAFHDSEKVLQSVGSMHDEVCTNVRNSDYVTRFVIERMVAEMLDVVDARPNTRQLWFKAQKALRDAERELKAGKKEQPEAGMSSQKRAPPVLPPDFLHILPDQTGRNDIHGRRSSLHRKDARRSATYNVLTPENRRVSSKTMADAEYESPDEMSTSNLTQPASPPDPSVDNNNQHRTPSARSSAYQPISPAQQGLIDTFSQNHSPTPPSKVRKRTSNRGSDQHQPSSPREPVAGLNNRASNETLSDGDGSVADNPSGQLVDSGPSHPKSHHKRTAMMGTSSPSGKQHAPRKLPYTSIVEAENWMLKRKQSGNTSQALEHQELLDQMSDRDHVRRVPDPINPKYSNRFRYFLSTMLPRCSSTGID